MREQFERGVPGIPNLNPLNGMKLNGECKNFKCAPHTERGMGYQVLFFLKFYYKVICIEQCWAFAKQVYCQFPASSAEADQIKHAFGS